MIARIGELEAAISADGLTSTSRRGLVRLHPAVVEVRQSRLALARLPSDMGCVTIQRTPVKHRAADRRCRLSRPKCCRIAGDQLIPEEYQRIGTPHPGGPAAVLGHRRTARRNELLKGKSRVFPDDTIVPAEDD